MVAKPMAKTARIPEMKANDASPHEYTNNGPSWVNYSLPDTAIFGMTNYSSNMLKPKVEFRTTPHVENRQRRQDFV